LGHIIQLVQLCANPMRSVENMEIRFFADLA